MYPEKPNNNKQKAVAGLVALVVIALLAGGVTAYNAQQSTQTSTSISKTPSVTNSSPAPAGNEVTTTPSATAKTYKDGSYSASTTYFVPSGSEDIKVTLTVRSDVITDSQVEHSGKDRESKIFQQEFSEGYKSQVVGKSIKDLQLSSISGASDTSRAFEEALEKIRSQAQA